MSHMKAVYTDNAERTIILSFSYSLEAFLQRRLVLRGDEIWQIGCHECLFLLKEEAEHLDKYCQSYAPSQWSPEEVREESRPYINACVCAIAEGRFFGRQGSMPGEINWAGFFAKVPLDEEAHALYQEESLFGKRDLLVEYGYTVFPEQQ